MSDLIALAKQAMGITHIATWAPPHNFTILTFNLQQLQAFADLIRKEEREACALVAETQWFKSDMRLWEAIRARGTTC